MAQVVQYLKVKGILKATSNIEPARFVHEDNQENVKCTRYSSTSTVLIFGVSGLPSKVLPEVLKVSSFSDSHRGAGYHFTQCVNNLGEGGRREIRRLGVGEKTKCWSAKVKRKYKGSGILFRLQLFVATDLLALFLICHLPYEKGFCRERWGNERHIDTALGGFA